MRPSILQLTLITLLALCLTSAGAITHGSSAALDSFGLSIAEYSETASSGSDGNDTPEQGDATAPLPASSLSATEQTGLPGTPQRVLEARHHLTRFPKLAQGPPSHA